MIRHACALECFHIYSVHMAQMNAEKDVIRVAVNVSNAVQGVNLKVFVFSCAFGLRRFVCRSWGVLEFPNMS